MYLGEKRVSQALQDIVNFNEHILAIEDEEERFKYQSYFDLNMIPEKYKSKVDYYKKFSSQNTFPTVMRASSPLKSNITLRKLTKKLLTPDASPLLAESSVMERTPKTYMIVCEWDALKDQELLYATRLMNSNVEIEIAFYESCFHGMATMIEAKLGYKTAQIMLQNMVNYIKTNI